MSREGFDGAAAVTRSLLGWGVVAGPFYLVLGVVLALTRPGFSFARHPLSALLLGPGGWWQALNLILSGVMTAAAAFGLLRALTGRRARWTGGLVGVDGLCLVLSAIFPPDPVAGFPPGSGSGAATTSGLLHLVLGGVGFLALGAAALVSAGAFRPAGVFRAAGGVVILGFLGGAALSPGGAGVALLWVAVVVGWAWLATASIAAYRIVPHPELHRRTVSSAA